MGGDRKAVRLVADALQQALADADPDFLEAVIVRTMPNDRVKRRRRYAEEPAPFFSIEAMHAINGFGVEHLLVAMQSIKQASTQAAASTRQVEASLHELNGMAQRMNEMAPQAAE